MTVSPDYFKQMTDEELHGSLESHSNALQSTPGGSISVKYVLDEALRRLQGGAAEPKPEDPDAPAADAAAAPAPDAVTSTETLKGG